MNETFRLSQLLREHVLTGQEMDEFLSSEPFKLAFQLYLDKRAERFQNGKSGVTQVIRGVEFCNRPYTDEKGKYVAYKCPCCGVPAKIRQAKVREVKKSEDPKQENLPNVEVPT